MKLTSVFILLVVIFCNAKAFSQAKDSLQDIESPVVTDSLVNTSEESTVLLFQGNGKNQDKRRSNFEKYGYLMNDVRTEDNGKEVMFYAACGLLFLLGLFRSFYSHYFSNLVSVYFNTSLRQTQLAEQLMQDKLPSFIFNLFFVLTTGAFLWLLILNSDSVLSFQPLIIFEVSLLAVAVIYVIKFFFLKFIGWVSGLSVITDRYIFIIFLVNKLLTIVLLPFVILMIFGKPEWMKVYVTLALSFSGFLLLSRYVKSYGLIRQNFPVTIFHFLLFFIGAELLPLLIIYKAASEYFTI